MDTDGLTDRVLRTCRSRPAITTTWPRPAAASTTSAARSKDGGPTLQMYDLAAQKETGLGYVDGFEISADGKKMLVRKDDKYGIIDLPKGTVSIGEPLNLSGMEMQLDRHAEWRQIFNECWRQMRDFFYDPNMHGVDWKAVREKYAPLVAHVNHRADLTYVIGEMIGELNAGHAYVGGGDMPKSSASRLGLLGAEPGRRTRQTRLFQDRQDPPGRELGRDGTAVRR